MPPQKGKSKKTPKRVAPPAGKPKTVSLTVSDPLLAAYLREIGRYPILTREEERAQALRYYETKDRESLQRLVTSNLRFVVKIAYEYAHYRVKLLDLIQEGNMGLVKAVQDFNPFRDVRLTTYAVWWIRSYIQDAILKNYSLVKVGTTQAQKKLFYRLRKEQRKLETLSLPASEKTRLIADQLEVTPKEVEEMDVRLSGGDLSLNTPVSEEKKEHLENLRYSGPPIDEQLGDSEQRKIFHEILGRFSRTLQGREKVFFNDRLISEDPLTLEQMGAKYGVSKERARQIEEQLKRKLKEYVERHFPDYSLLAE